MKTPPQIMQIPYVLPILFTLQSQNRTFFKRGLDLLPLCKVVPPILHSVQLHTRDQASTKEKT